MKRVSLEFLCCLMTTGLSKDIQHHTRQLYLHQQLSSYLLCLLQFSTIITENYRFSCLLVWICK